MLKYSNRVSVYCLNHAANLTERQFRPIQFLLHVSDKMSEEDGNMIILYS
jgi:hypothetical protein